MITRTTLRTALALAMLAAYSVPANAMDASDSISLAGATHISDQEMSTMRAGFFDPTGLIFSFAVDVQTQIDGALKFIRSIVMKTNPTGQMTASSTASIQTNTLPTASVATVVDNGRGVTVSDSKGTTTVLNQTDTGTLASVVVNTADNRQISQQIDINLVLKGAEVSRYLSHGSRYRHSINGINQMSRMRGLGFGR